MADITTVSKIVLTAEDRTGQGATSAANNLNKVASATDAIRKHIGNLAGALSVGMFAGAIRDAIETADALNDMARKTGVAVETLGGLQYAFSMAGVSSETLEKSLVKLSANMAEAAGGNKELNAAFQAIGVSVRDASGHLKSADAMLLDLADRFAELEDSPEKTALALKAMGKAGADLISGLDDGSEKIREAIAEYQRYGGVTTEVAQAADAFNDTVARIQLMFGALFRTIASAILPTLQTLANQFADTKNTAEGFSVVAQGVAVFVKVMATAAIGAVEAFKALGNSLGAVAAAFTLAIQGDFKGALQALKLGFTDVSASIRAAVGKARDVWSSDTAIIAAKAEENLGKRPKAAIAAMAKDSSKEMQKLLDQYNSLVTSLQGADLGIDSSFAAKFALLTRAYNGEIKGVVLSLEQYRELVQKLLDQQPFAKKQREELEKLIKVEQDYLDIQQKQNEEATITLGNYADENTRRALEVSLIGQSNLVREKALILADAEIQKTKLRNAGDIEGLAILEEQIKKRLELAEIADTRTKAIEQQKKGYEDLFAWVDDLTTQLWAAVTAKGGDAFQKITDVLKSTLLATLYKMAVQPFVVNVVAAITGQGAGGLVGQAGGLLNLFGGSGGGLGGIGNWFSGGGIFGGGGMFNAFATGGIGQWLGLSAAGLDTAGGVALTGLGTALGGILPVVGAIAALAPLLSGLFSKGGGPKSGGFASVGDITGIGNTDSTGRWFTPSGEDATVQKIVDATSKSYTDLLRQLGGSGNAAFALGFDTDPQGKAPNRVHAGTFIDGQQVYDAALGDLGRDDATLKAALETEAKRSLLAALQASDLPDYLGKFFDSLEAATATSDQIDELIATGQILKQVVDAFADLGPVFAALDPEQIQQLAEAFGGLKEFAASAAFIAQNFTTTAQKLDSATTSLTADFDALGIKVPESHEAFLKLLASFDLTTEEGRDLYASVSQLAPAFVAVNGTADDAAAAAQELADQLDAARAVLTDFNGALRVLSDADLQGIADLVGGVDALNDLLGDFDKNFIGDAQRQQAAMQEVDDTFTKLGITVPRSNKEFVKLLDSIDTSTTEGQQLYATLLKVSSAFALANGTAQDHAILIGRGQSFFNENFYTDEEQTGRRIRDAWDAIHYVWTQFGGELMALGYDALPTTNEGFRRMIERLRALGLDELADELVAYSSTIFALNQDIASLAESAEDAAAATERLNAAYQASVQAATEVQDRFGKIWSAIQEIVGQSGGGFGDKLALTMALIPEQINALNAELEAAYARGDIYGPLPQQIKAVITQLQLANEKAAAQLARFTILSAQYDESRAEQLVELEEWFEGMKVAIGNSPEALAALQKVFDEKWQAIIDGTAAGVEGTLSQFQKLQQGIREFLDSLRLSDISPLTPLQKLTEAKAQYDELLGKAQGGDLDALAKITDAAREYLELARKYSPAGYPDVFNAVTSALEQLATMQQPSQNADAALVAVLPTGSKLMSADDAKQMTAEILAGLGVVVTAVNASATQNNQAVETQTQALTESGTATLK